MFILGRGETIKGLVSCFISKLCVGSVSEAGTEIPIQCLNLEIAK